MERGNVRHLIINSICEFYLCQGFNKFLDHIEVCAQHVIPWSLMYKRIETFFDLLCS